jgi:hypothetical protein
MLLDEKKSVEILYISPLPLLFASLLIWIFSKGALYAYVHYDVGVLGV